MKFPQNFLAGAWILTAGARGEITGVCTALGELSCDFDFVYLIALPVILLVLNINVK